MTNVNPTAAVALITSHADNIIDLTVDYEDPTDLEIGDVELPNLKQLHIQWLDRTDAFVLIRAGWANLTELGIEDVEINKEDLEELYIPNLQTLNVTHSDEFYDYFRFGNYVYIQKE